MPDSNTIYTPSRRIYGNFDEKGIYVYQAFDPRIVQSALLKGTFDQGFSLNRMTWIKPSFGWMLQRSGYATKHNQSAILKIYLKHEGFLEILEQAISTSYYPQIFNSELDWASQLNHSEVRYQWDPDRDIKGNRLFRRAIQLGIRGKTVLRYIKDWIIGLEEVTELAHKIDRAKKEGKKILPECPNEREYPISTHLQKKLGYD